MEKSTKTKLSRQAIGRILIAVFCLSIAVCVAVVMFHIYDPNENALGALSSVCMDVTCMIILFILIGSFAFDNFESKKTTRIFALLLMATIWAMFLDFLNWAFDGSLEFGHLTYWFTLGSLCMGAVLACIFSLYLYSYMEENHGLTKMRMSAIVCAGLNMVSFCVTLVLALTGTAFEFVDGHYEVGALYDVVTIIPILSLLYLTGFVIVCVKKVGAHDVFAVAGYIFFMIAGALIESEYRIGTTYVAVAIADIFIFIMLQNEIIAVEKRNVQKWMEKSTTDELTGLLNRHAYEADMKALEGEGLADDFVFVSIDVNSLKTVNDSMGHSVGDELLIGASEVLEKCLGDYGKLYRIGGDEFIALINASEEQLASIRKDIDEYTRKSEQSGDNLTFSCGYVTRREAEKMTIKQMSVLADRRMYQEKDEYYRRTGIERRKK